MTDHTNYKKGMTQAKKRDGVQQLRDTFETPRYAVELLLPFIPECDFIWECAAGTGRITRVLRDKQYSVMETDISSMMPFNFVTQTLMPETLLNGVIITNPPYSIKERFIDKAMWYYEHYHTPFAFLINADYSGQQIKWIREYGCEKIIPTRRISYITPNAIERVNAANGTSYLSVNEIPQRLLYKDTSSQFHSMWLTKGFNLGQTETFVDLPIEHLKERIL